MLTLTLTHKHKQDRNAVPPSVPQENVTRSRSSFTETKWNSGIPPYLLTGTRSRNAIPHSTGCKGRVACRNEPLTGSGRLVAPLFSSGVKGSPAVLCPEGDSADTRFMRSPPPAVGLIKHSSPRVGCRLLSARSRPLARQGRGTSLAALGDCRCTWTTQGRLLLAVAICRALCSCDAARRVSPG